MFSSLLTFLVSHIWTFMNLEKLSHLKIKSHNKTRKTGNSHINKEGHIWGPYWTLSTDVCLTLAASDQPLPSFLRFLGRWAWNSAAVHPWDIGINVVQGHWNHLMKASFLSFAFLVSKLTSMKDSQTVSIRGPCDTWH